MTPTNNLYTVWPSHFIVRQLAMSDDDNAALATLCRDFVAKSMANNGTNNYRKTTDSLYALPPTPALQRYFAHLREGLAMYLNLYSLTLDDVDVEFDGFANVETYRQWATTHAHVSNQLVITYYPHVFRGADEHERGGCLYWLGNDPKMSNWMMRREQSQFEIRPETGTQVVFPGYLNHATNALFAKDSEKIALVTNVRINDPSVRTATKYMRADQILGVEQ